MHNDQQCVCVCMCLCKCIVHRSFTSRLPFSYQPGACNVYIADRVHNTVKTVAGAAYDRLFSTDNAAINTVLHRQCCHQQCSPQTMLPSTLFSTDNAAINSVLHRQSCHQHCSPQTMLPSTVFSTKLPSTAASLH